MYVGEQQRGWAEKRPRPFGLRRKTPQPVLLVVYSASQNVSPRAVPDTFCGSKAASPPCEQALNLFGEFVEFGVQMIDQ